MAMTSPLHWRRTLLALGTAVLTCSAWAQTGDYPNQPVKLIVPFPAGGSTDLVARALATEWATALNQSVVVENKAGAGSLIGTEFVHKAPADGYTVLMAGLTNVFLPYVHKTLRFHPMNDFALVGLVADLPNVLAVNASTPYRKLDDLVQAEKARPRQLSFASAGIATPSHLVCEMVNHRAGTKLNHIPYKGNAPAVADVMGGHVPVMCNNLGGTLPYMSSGQIRILAQTGKARSAAAPDVPTFAELGLPGLDAGLWMGVVAPRGTPREVVDKLNRTLTQTLGSSTLKDKLAKLGATILPSSIPAFEDRIRQDQKAWDPVLSTLDLKSN
jgi:tripartite-type tricarboxylate transporter receptor subunit TctC